MNLVNALLGVLLLAILVMMGYKVGQLVIELNTPQIPQTIPASFVLPPQPIENGTFARWNHFPLTVYIKTESLDASDADYLIDFKQAMKTWETDTNGLVAFTEVSNPEADIAVEWVAQLKEKSLDNIGDTELKFVNVTYGGIVKNADIELLLKSGSKKLNSYDMTNLALHELGHALGLRHTDDNKSIMYPVLQVPSNNVIQISDKEKNLLEEIYSIQPKPDLKIIEVNVTKATIKRFTQTYHLLNVSMIIENDGILNSPPPVLQIKASDKIAKKESTLNIDVGARLSVVYGNLLVENDFTTVEILLDPDNLIDELDETNNMVALNIVQQ